MILYEGTIEQFNEDVMQNCIADRTADKYRAYYKKNPGDSEYRSWAHSLAILNNSFIYALFFLKNFFMILTVTSQI